MRAYFDTEFIQWFSTPLTLASIGIVRDDGRELYRVANHGISRSKTGPWFRKNIWPQLENEPKFSPAEISDAVAEFLIPVSELVTRGGDSDWKLLDQLVGPAWFTRTDIDHIWNGRKCPRLPIRKHKAHHALIDARWYRTLYDHLEPIWYRAAA